MTEHETMKRRKNETAQVHFVFHVDQFTAKTKFDEDVFTFPESLIDEEKRDEKRETVLLCLSETLSH